MDFLTVVTILSLIATVLSVGSIVRNAFLASLFRKKLESKNYTITIETRRGEKIRFSSAINSRQDVKEFTESLDKLLRA